MCVILPRSSLPHKLIDCTRRRLVKEATKTPMTILKEFKNTAAEIGETLHTATVAGFFRQSLMGKWRRESHC